MFRRTSRGLALRSLRSTAFQSLEQRVLLSTTLPVMGYLVDYKIGNSANTVFSESYSGPTPTIAHDTLDWAHLSQVNYFALTSKATPAFNGTPTAASLSAVTSDGTLNALTDSGYNPALQLPVLVQEAHAKNPNTKVYVTIGAGDPAAIYDFDGIINTPASWTTFATSLHNFVAQYGLDGVDLDWEPTAQAGFTVTAAQITNFGQLIKTIRTAYPTMGLTSDALGFPQALTTATGVNTHTSAYELDSVAVQYLDKIEIEAYPGVSKTQADSIMQSWATYLTGGSDLNGKTVYSPIRKLEYGLDISSDDTTNNPPGVLESKVDTTITKGYGGMFIYELDSDTGTGSSSFISRIASEASFATLANTDIITGTNGADSITLTKDVDGLHVDWSIGSTIGEALLNDPNGLTILGNGANDSITLNSSHGSPLPALLNLNGTFTVTGLSTLANTTLDLGTSTVYFKYASGSDPLTSLKQFLTAGNSGGFWNGTSSTGSIISSAAAADATRATAIGYADAADGLNVNTATGTVELRYTYYGDANLDRVVDFSDLLLLAKGYGTAGTSWDQGDFDGNGTTDFSDLLVLAKNYSKHLSL